MQSKVPTWAPPKRKWPRGFTAHRDGWVRSYRGRTVWVAGKTVDVKELPRLFEAKTRELPRHRAKAATMPDPSGLTFGELFSAFLAFKDRQAETGRIQKRTLMNYEYELNRFGDVIGGSKKLAASIGPREFTTFMRTIDKLSPMTINSTLARVNALFKWAYAMDLIPRPIFGPEWLRPRKKEIRSQRMEVQKVFGPDEFAKLWRASNDRMRLWIGLGVCAAFTNADIATLTREVVDLDNGRIDFARRKTGKVRRCVVLPKHVAELMRAYQRPRPVDAKFDDFFFLGRDGIPINHATSRHSTNTVSVEFNRVQQAAGVYKEGRGFTGLRTTFYNLAPKPFEIERMVIMGRAHGDIDLDHYLETVGIDRIEECVRHVWSSISSELAGPVRAT